MARITRANVVQRNGTSIPNADLVAHGVSLFGPANYAAFNGINGNRGDHIALKLDEAPVPFTMFQQLFPGWILYLSDDPDNPSPLMEGQVSIGGSGRYVGIGTRQSAAYPHYDAANPAWLIAQATEQQANGHAQFVQNG